MHGIVWFGLIPLFHIRLGTSTRASEVYNSYCEFDVSKCTVNEWYIEDYLNEVGELTTNRLSNLNLHYTRIKLFGSRFHR